jgi:DNA mismatch endonuclease (patch repair protein)
MADIVTKAKRSDMMSRVRSRGNRATEQVLAKLLRAHKITGWRRHPKLPGTPDFVFRKDRLVIFVDGCFWHVCPKHATFPMFQADFWLRKLADNKLRDRRINKVLRQRGWKVLRIWQHELKPKHSWACIAKIRRAFAHSCSKSIFQRKSKKAE